jgi:hypothetical protein
MVSKAIIHPFSGSEPEKFSTFMKLYEKELKLNKN